MYNESLIGLTQWFVGLLHRPRDTTWDETGDGLSDLKLKM